MSSLFRPALLSLIILLHLGGAHAQTPGSKGSQLLGYTFETDVSNHARIDLDQKVMDTETDVSDWEEAKKIYTDGKNSKKSDDSLRTLQGFSKTAPTKMKNEGFYNLYREYWDDDTYADTFVTSALDGTGNFSGMNDKFRAECANKGSQYQNVWMYVIHEMEDAIDDCTKKNLEDNDDSVEAWDEAWAFYTGSLAAKEDGGKGMLLYTLAQKRCNAFGTCGSGSTANVNTEVLKLFKQGQKQLGEGECDNAVDTKNNIVKWMTVPLVQGTIKYAYTIDEKKINIDKEHGEAWAFAAAMLPLVDHCSSGVAKVLTKNFEPKATPVADGPAKIVEELSKVYNCLGFKCSDVGKTNNSEYPECSESGSFKKVPGTDKPANDARPSGSSSGSGTSGSGTSGSGTSGSGTSGSGSSGGGTSGSGASGSGSTANSSSGNEEKSGGSSVGKIVGIVVGVLVAALIVTGLFFYIRSRKPKVVLPPSPEEGGAFA